MASQEFGIIGLGVMGQNLALNIERNGFTVAGFDLDASKMENLKSVFEGKNVFLAPDMNDFLGALQAPKRILMMVPAGRPVDDVIAALRPHLQKDDILIDGGNSFFRDTERRSKDLEAAGLRFIGTGVSGGEEGALKGPAIMPGGTESAYRLVEPILTKISAHVENIPCCAYIGAGGAGHFVKMVHNSIEYGDMQIICEAYDILKSALGYSAPEISKVFRQWNEGPLNSYLMEITVAVLDKMDDETGKPLVDVILDTAGQKGTGNGLRRWRSTSALRCRLWRPPLKRESFHQ